MNRLELHISYACLNNCFFCSEHNQLKKLNGYFLPKAAIQKKIAFFSKKGFTHVTFTGGEPTYHPDFLEIISSARETGYQTYVTTNGGYFADKDFSRRALPVLNEICFSVHGHNTYLHETATQKKGSFKNLMLALENLEEVHDCSVYGLANIVLTSKNINYITDIITLLACYKKIKQVIVSNFSPEGAGFKNFLKLALSLKSINKKILPIVECANHNGLKIVFFGLPLCVLNNHHEISNDFWWSPRATCELWTIKKKRYLKTTYSRKPDRGRGKTKKCLACRKNSICGGVFLKYLKEFGDSEIQAITI